MAKGAGMLAPGLATMLVVLTTDAVVEPDRLDAVLRQATVDDLRPGRLRRLHVHQRHRPAARVRRVRGRRPTDDELLAAVETVCADLARQLVDDAEGSTKSIAVTVARAATVDDAVTVGRAVSRSNLLKCAIHGEDPNWGRVLSAVGTTDAAFEPEHLAVALNGVWVCRDGAAAEDRGKVDLSAREVTITVDLGAGDARGDGLDQRPHRRLRARELGVLDMSSTVTAGTRRRSRRPASWSTRCPGWSGSTAGPSW